MRYKILLNSVRKLLDADETLYDAALMWARHRHGYSYSVGAFVFMVAVAAAAGFDDWFSRLGLGVAGAALALTATTMYRVLAVTSTGLVLMEAGRVRQVARKRLADLADNTQIIMRRDTLVTTDWSVDGHEYTVPKGSQKAMERIAAIQRKRS